MKMKYCTTTPDMELAQPNDDENSYSNLAFPFLELELAQESRKLLLVDALLVTP